MEPFSSTNYCHYREADVDGARHSPSQVEPLVYGAYEECTTCQKRPISRPIKEEKRPFSTDIPPSRTALMSAGFSRAKSKSTVATPISVSASPLPGGSAVYTAMV